MRLGKLYIVWKMDFPLSMYELGCSVSDVSDVFRMGHPFLSLLRVPRWLSCWAVVLLGNALLYPFFIFDQFVYMMLDEKEIEEFDRQEKESEEYVKTSAVSLE